MEYFLITLSTVCVAGQFVFNKFYQKYVVKNTDALLWMPILTGGIAVVLFLCLNKFTLTYGSFSFIIASAEALVLTLCMLCSIFVVKFGSVAVFTVFIMLGGMLLPFVYGLLFLQEKLSIAKAIGMLILILSLFLSVKPEQKAVKKEKPSAVFYFLCLAVFVLNGGVSIFSKVHQINAAAVPTLDYMIWLYLMQFAISLVCFGVYRLFFKRKAKAAASEELTLQNDSEIHTDKITDAKKQILLAFCICCGYVLFSGCGYLLQLNAAKELDASLLYPFITGGSVLFSTISALVIFKEKLGLWTWISLILTLLGTILFIF